MKNEYLISGKSETCLDYARRHVKKNVYCQILTRKGVQNIKNKSKVILLPGWWMREWFVDYYKDIIEDNVKDITFVCEDGHGGKEFRDKINKELKSDSIKDRFEIIDI